MNILFLTLSNIGDVILTFPALDAVRGAYPEAKITVMLGPKAFSLLQGSPYFQDVKIYDKQQSLIKTGQLIYSLRKQKFDIAVDLRHTAIPFFTGVPKRTPLYISKEGQAHMRDKHLNRLHKVVPDIMLSEEKYSLSISENDKIYVERLLSEKVRTRSFCIFSAGAADHRKRWPQERFARVADVLREKFGWQPVFVGDKDDDHIVRGILNKMNIPGINLCGDLSLIQLAQVVQCARISIMNDSAPMHIASYLDAPVIGLFGPTNPLLYGPWGKGGCFIKSTQHAFDEPVSMETISIDHVLNSINIIDDAVILSGATI